MPHHPKYQKEVEWGKTFLRSSLITEGAASQLIIELKSFNNKKNHVLTNKCVFLPPQKGENKKNIYN